MNIDKKICSLRKKLDDSIKRGEDYSKIYKISLQLDKLIVEYYLNKKKNVP